MDLIELDCFKMQYRSNTVMAIRSHTPVNAGVKARLPVNHDTHTQTPSLNV